MCLQLTINDVDSREWIYPRDHRIRRPVGSGLRGVRLTLWSTSLERRMCITQEPKSNSLDESLPPRS
jgi:hypothetical protein